MQMSNEFHTHEWRGNWVPMPGPVYECDDECCRANRRAIEDMAHWPLDQLNGQIAFFDSIVTAAGVTAANVRAALELKRRQVN